jgi:transcription initiation factor TFIID TATA-box-binding protein
MDNNPYITHPSTAQQAQAFTAQQQAPSSLSYPNGAGHLTPPMSDKDGSQSQQKAGAANGQAGNGVVPNTPAATPGAGAGAGVSGIVPTLQ